MLKAKVSLMLTVSIENRADSTICTAS